MTLQQSIKFVVHFPECESDHKMKQELLFKQKRMHRKKLKFELCTREGVDPD